MSTLTPPQPELVRQLSKESLTAHPLLSSSEPPSSQSSQPLRYVPYTPRQRVPSSTSVTIQPSVAQAASSPQQHLATSRLQLQNLKAVAQNIGISPGTLGWAFLEKLVEAEDNQRWNAIWQALTVDRATLLLPCEPVPSTELITPELVTDHVVYCNNTARNSEAAVSLSGLRYDMNGDTLSLRSILPKISKQFQALQNTDTRISALKSLSPLSTAKAAFPSYNVSAFASNLPLPPRAASKLSSSRQGNSALSSLPSRGNSRLSSLTSFFSKSTTAVSISSADTPPEASSSSSSQSSEPVVIDIAGFAIDRRISRKETVKSLPKTFRAQLRNELDTCAPWVLDRVLSFAAPLIPQLKPPPPREKCQQDPWEASPEDVAQMMQALYSSLADDLRGSKESPVTPRRADHNENLSGAISSDRKEDSVMEIIGLVERALTTVFYDRLFRPIASDDASHDEALANRIAALNLLDLNLEHLGIEVKEVHASAVQAVVNDCGETLMRLNASGCRSPADKAAVLVAAHKVVVDGLSRIPPLRLKSQEELSETGTPKVSEFPDQQGFEEKAFVSTPEPTEIVVEEALLDVPAATDPKPTTVAGDILLPIIIFAVVKTNPSQLISHLLFVQRFRNQAVGGEEAYCLVNLLAVAEFLENVDMAALGLGDSDRVMDTADLTPIPLPAPDEPTALASASTRLRGRVEQQVDALAGSANKVLSGVVDTSVGVLRGLLAPATALTGIVETPAGEEVPWNPVRPGFGLLRRGSAFTIASVAASLPGRERSRVDAVSPEEEGRQMTEVSSLRASSIREGSDNEDEEFLGEEESEDDRGRDARSIRSFGSMMSRRSRRDDPSERMSLTDRLAGVSAHVRARSTAHDRTGSREVQLPVARGSPLIVPNTVLQTDTPTSSRLASPAMLPPPLPVAPPNHRFLECDENDLRVHEVPELLREYRRVVEALRAHGGFEA